MDNFSEIPAGVHLGVYKSRMTLSATYDDISLLRLSWPGEPEAIDQVDGNVIIPLNGNPITNGQEYRDVYYCTKLTMTYAVVDNGDVPSTWPAPQPIDQGIGASVHGICKVLDSDGVNIEFFIVAGLNGVYLFNGVFQKPELTWKIDSRWKQLARTEFSNMQIMNDSIGQFIYITMRPNGILFANYNRGLDAKNIRWAPWDFDFDTNSIAIVQTNVLVIGN